MFFLDGPFNLNVIFFDCWDNIFSPTFNIVCPWLNVESLKSMDRQFEMEFEEWVYTLPSFKKWLSELQNSCISILTLKKVKHQPRSNPLPNTKSSDPKLENYPKPDPYSWPEPVTLLGVSLYQPPNPPISRIQSATSIPSLETCQTANPDSQCKRIQTQLDSVSWTPKLEPTKKGLSLAPSISGPSNIP